MFYFFELNEDVLGREVALLTSKSISKPKDDTLFIESNNDYSNGCYILENGSVVDKTSERDSIFLEKAKKDLLIRLKQTTKRIYKRQCIGIDESDEDSNFKILEYNQKYDWALTKKKQIDAGEGDIDYSLYHDHAIVFNHLCKKFGIMEEDVDVAYVLLIIRLHEDGMKKMSLISLNEYSISSSIELAKDIKELSLIEKDMIKNICKNVVKEELVEAMESESIKEIKA
jgi:hypothetical protein